MSVVAKKPFVAIYERMYSSFTEPYAVNYWRAAVRNIPPNEQLSLLDIDKTMGQKTERISTNFLSYHNPINDDFFLETDELCEQGFHQLQGLKKNLHGFRFPFGLGSLVSADASNCQHDATGPQEESPRERFYVEMLRKTFWGDSAQEEETTEAVSQGLCSDGESNWFIRLFRNGSSQPKEREAKQDHGNLSTE